MCSFNFTPADQIPVRLEDSGLVACPSGVFTTLLTLGHTSKWIQIFTTIGGLTIVTIATGPPGGEVQLFDLHLPAVVNFVIAFNGLFQVLTGTRISANPNAAGVSIELHCMS